MSDRLRRSFVLLTLTALAMAALLAFLPAAGHDQIWFLLMAKRWLGGATLYGPEIFDSNPPLVVWLSALPVWLGHLLSLPATTCGKTLILLTWVGAGTLAGRLLSRVWRPFTAGESPALLFAFTTIFLVIPARDLGQRDALTALLVLPYVLAAAARDGLKLGLVLRFTAALLAALGFCLKPQDALIAVAVEISLLVGMPIAAVGKFARRGAGIKKSLARVEPPILVGCGLLYLFAIRHFAPLYLSETLPILRNTYWAIGHLSLPALFWKAIELTILAAFTLPLMVRFPPASSAAKILSVAGFGAFAAYLAQGTGWYYQQLPAISLFGAALALHLLDLQRRRPTEPPRWFLPALATLCVLAVALTTHFTGYPFTADRAFAIDSPNPAFFADLPSGMSVAILTTSVDEAMMPVERYHLTWAQRTNNLWLLPAILRSQQPDPAHPNSRYLTPLTLARLAGMQHRWMVEDLARWRPKLILVERCQDPTVSCQELEDRHDDLLAWFERSPDFVSLWHSYTFAGTRGRFDSYILTPQN